jgi:hypothetical protein
MLMKIYILVYIFIQRNEFFGKQAFLNQVSNQSLKRLVVKSLLIFI